MDKQVFIDKLKGIFCDSYKQDKKYSKVWLTDADFGGLYNSGSFVLNIKAEHHIEECNLEIRHVLKMLAEGITKEEFQYIRSVAVYNTEDEVHCESDDIILYSEEVSCER
jgi:hypothetical protein